jgi:hypothetical protein
VEREPYNLLFGERKGPDGQKLGRSPANAGKAVEIYKGLVAAEHGADDHRRAELRIMAQREARQSPLYFDLTTSWSKDIAARRERDVILPFHRLRVISPQRRRRTSVPGLSPSAPHERAPRRYGPTPGGLCPWAGSGSPTRSPWPPCSDSESDTTGAVVPVETAATPPDDPVGSERSREAGMMHVLIYVAGFVLWPILFGALARRLLGVEVGRVRRALSGLAGIGVGAVMSNAVTGGAWGIWNFIAYVIFAVLGTLAAVALLDFLVRPATVGHLRQSFGPVPHPMRAARRRVARGRRYASIISAFRRHGLLSMLSGRNRETTVEHRHARERRLGTQLSLALQEAGGVFVKLGQVLSTRPDVLGEHAAEQLSVLQDRVAPADQAAVERLLQAELGRPPDEVFERFDAVPLAAASIGQVHPRAAAERAGSGREGSTAGGRGAGRARPRHHPRPRAATRRHGRLGAAGRGRGPGAGIRRELAPRARLHDRSAQHANNGRAY